ncbi:MAG: protein kinase [Nocardiaceae bacterium]|nr:protein kinase [Nocardiaceae bacterium]
MSDEPFAERQIGPYVLRSLLGKGGMGEVYEAFDTSKERVVALKLLSPELSHDETFRERFRRESYAAARLHEPHVIPIHDFGEIDGRLFIDMRLVRGSDVRKLLRTEAFLSPSRAVHITEQVASALDAAHHDGLLHRDVKPENVLVADGDFAYLADFGIARSFTDSSLTSTQATVGTCQYMAPERLEDGKVGPGADIYSLACVLFEMLAGVPPFRGASLGQLVRQHLSEPPPQVSLVRPGVPQSLDAVIARGLAKNPAERFATAGEFAEAARRALTGATPPPNATSVMPTMGAGFDQPEATTAWSQTAVHQPTTAGQPDRPKTAPQPVVPTQYAAPMAPHHPPKRSKATTATLVLLVLAVLALAGAFGWLVWTTKLGGGSSTATGTTTMTTTTTTAITPVPDADAQGFTSPPGPRCNGVESAAIVGRSEGWQVVVCKGLFGRYTFKAVELNGNDQVSINGASGSGSSYTATSRDGTTYETTDEHLVVTKNGNVVADDRWTAFTQN